MEIGKIGFPKKKKLKSLKLFCGKVVSRGGHTNENTPVVKKNYIKLKKKLYIKLFLPQ
jgi:hypothetical protein